MPHQHPIFFVSDQIQLKEVVIEYCPIDEMLADMFTKPLQGTAFHHFQAAILNLQEDKNAVCPAMVLKLGHRSVLGNESVETNSRQTRESDDSGGRKQMAKQMAKVSVEMKNEPSAHSF